MDALRNSDSSQITISLIGEDDSILPGPFHPGGHRRSPAMRCLQNIDIEIIVHKNGTSHGGHPDRPLPDLEIVNGFRYQTMSDTVVASRTEMERNINQTLGTFENKFHNNLI
jgi:hypothetical protein